MVKGQIIRENAEWYMVWRHWMSAYLAAIIHRLVWYARFYCATWIGTLSSHCSTILNLLCFLCSEVVGLRIESVHIFFIPELKYICPCLPKAKRYFKSVKKKGHYKSGPTKIKILSFSPFTFKTLDPPRGTIMNFRVDIPDNYYEVYSEQPLHKQMGFLKNPWVASHLQRVLFE